MAKTRLLMMATVLLLLAGNAVPKVRAADDSAMPAHTSFTLQSRILHESRLINVYTPPGYASQEKAKFPVMYMPDGGMQEDFPQILARDFSPVVSAGQPVTAALPDS